MEHCVNRRNKPPVMTTATLNPLSMTMSTQTFLTKEIVEQHLLPSARKLDASLESLLHQAQIHQRNCFIAKTIATTIGAVGSIVTCVGISLSTATMGLSVTFSTPLAFSLTGLAAMISIGTVLVDEFVLKQRSMEQLVKIVADYKAARYTWMERLNFDRLDLCVKEAELSALYRSPEFRSSLFDSLLLSLKLKFVDNNFAIQEVREVDHITHQRRLLNKHNHGIYIGENSAGVKLVADFGSHLPILRPMDEFCSKIITKSVSKHNMEVEKEIIAIQLLNQGWNHVNRLTTKIADLSKPIQTTFDAIVATIHGANFVFKIKFDKMFTDVLKVVRAKDAAGKIKWRTLGELAPQKATKKIGNFSKTLVLLTPIMTAVDVYQLCKECQDQELQPHVREIVAQLNLVENDVNTFENILQLLGSTT